MKKPLLGLSLCAPILFSTLAFANESTPNVTGNEGNPAVSLILNGGYVDRDEGDLELSGFQIGGEAGLPEQGFSTGHNELGISSNIDDKFFGSATMAIVEEEGEVVVELEEAYLETLKLGNGFTIKGGKFFSGFGYLNEVHDHAHDFTDKPLIYDAMFGGHLVDTGLQVRWLAPTDLYWSTGAEVTSGKSFPGGENEDGSDAVTVFTKIGGDFNESSSWRAGLSFYQTEFDVREAGGHAHGGEEATADNELKNAEVDVAGLDFVYKWAPNGNKKERNLIIQGEYFVRNEEGAAEFSEPDGMGGTETGEADYKGEQDGFYVQAVYQFRPMWRVGLRFDQLSADNEITNFMGSLDEEEFAEESGLESGDDPNRQTMMVDYSPSHFSRIRLQYSTQESGHEGEESIDVVGLQYVMSLGAHAAHSY